MNDQLERYKRLRDMYYLLGYWPEYAKYKKLVDEMEKE